MISTTRRSPNATLVTKTSIDQASEALQGLPEKTKEKLSLREAVDVLRDHITAALDKGYSYEDIAVMLAKQGVSIAPSSLKHYLARSNRQLKTRSGTQTRRKRTPKAAAVEPEAPTLEPVAEEAPPKRGRRSTKTAEASEPAAPKTTRRAASSRTKTASATPTRKRRTKAT